ncbi:NAD(P)H-hydrate dehydratase [Terrabacter terrigena]|uniref:ADP-dependent (S)-NAD(P)H-hydrate dehydratase n=1 Tax=Terrabacter terrigena TaxID=574718 RepID=A0ABW3MW64_9MICO
MSQDAPHAVDIDLLRGWPLPSSDGDKTDRGTVLVVGGSRQTPGAVVLAAESALRVGAGKVQVATAADAAPALSVAVPEAYVEALPVLGSGDLAVAAADRILQLAEGVDVVLLGPGLGDPECARLLLERVVPRLDTTVVIDALGTAYLTGNLDGVRHLEGRVLLTPNATELAETLQVTEAEVAEDPGDAARRLADATCAVVLSGAEVSCVVTPLGRSWRHEGGSPGLATAGSGDVKAGVVAGLMARGAPPEQAAVWGTWTHGRAGEVLDEEMPGFLARDLSQRIPKELAAVERSSADT